MIQELSRVFTKKTSCGVVFKGEAAMFRRGPAFCVRKLFSSTGKRFVFVSRYAHFDHYDNKYLNRYTRTCDRILQFVKPSAPKRDWKY